MAENRLPTLIRGTRTRADTRCVHSEVYDDGGGGGGVSEGPEGTSGGTIMVIDCREQNNVGFTFQKQLLNHRITSNRSVVNKYIAV